MDWLTTLVIVLLVLTLLDGVGYRTGWNEGVADGPRRRQSSALSKTCTRDGPSPDRMGQVTTRSHIVECVRCIIATVRGHIEDADHSGRDGGDGCPVSE
jgi:hypothetical protein